MNHLWLWNLKSIWYYWYLMSWSFQNRIDSIGDTFHDYVIFISKNISFLEISRPEISKVCIHKWDWYLFQIHSIPLQIIHMTYFWAKLLHLFSALAQSWVDFHVDIFLQIERIWQSRIPFKTQTKLLINIKLNISMYWYSSSYIYADITKYILFQFLFYLVM